VYNFSVKIRSGAGDFLFRFLTAEQATDLSEAVAAYRKDLTAVKICGPSGTLLDWRRNAPAEGECAHA
jgi:hypothetical protein